MRNRSNAKGPSRGPAKSSGASPRPFKKRAASETESRFSKPSIKKSSLKFSGESSAPRADRRRPEFPRDEKRSDKPHFDEGKSTRKFSYDKPDRYAKKSDNPSDRRKDGPRTGSFEKPAFRSEKPAFKKYDSFDKPAFRKTDSSERPAFRRDDKSDRPAFRKSDSSERPAFRREESSERPAFRRDDSRESRPREGRPDERKGGFSKENNTRAPRSTAKDSPAEDGDDRSGLERRVGKFEYAPKYNLSGYEDRKTTSKSRAEKKTSDGDMRLNRYISNAGICSRREADDLIASGQITVNGKTITEMGYKVGASDVVKYGKRALNPEKMVYILINKPKNYITTTDDPEERKTVLDLIQGACNERVYPVGRLDRNTTGLLLMTNDGELAEKLTHPSSGIKKIYQAELDKPITTEDFESLKAGIELEDGFIRPDEVGIVTPDAMVVGLEIHSGRNRIVRRMFEHLGYEVQKLDRTVFAGLNKKDLPRGKWRFLSEKEVIKLKFML